MKIIRAPRNGNFTIIPNETARDRSLSYRATGLLVELLSHDDGWETNAERIAARAKEGRDSIRGALKELREHRYMVTHKSRNPGGRWEYAHYVYDVPQPVDNTPTESPLKPVDNTGGPHRPTGARDSETAATGANVQVRAVAALPSTVMPSAVDPSPEKPPSGEPSPVPHVPADRSPVDRTREPRGFQEAHPTKNDKNPPPPDPDERPVATPDLDEQGVGATPATEHRAAPAPKSQVAQGIDMVLAGLPPLLAPRSQGQREGFLDALGPYLLAGWTPQQILQQALHEPYPEHVHSPAGFIKQRLATLASEPPVTRDSIPWCGHCDQQNRWREEPETGKPYRCPECHPAIFQRQSREA